MWLEGWWPSSVTTKSQTGPAVDPFASNFLVKGWSRLCSRREKKMLSSGCARICQGYQHCQDKNCDFWFSALCFLPLTVLTAVERGDGTSLSQQLCLHRAGQGPMDGTGRVPWMGQAGSPGVGQAPVTQGMLGCGALGQRADREQKWGLCLLPPEGW